MEKEDSSTLPEQDEDTGIEGGLFDLSRTILNLTETTKKYGKCPSLFSHVNG
jgi:hypothetical protein